MAKRIGFIFLIFFTLVFINDAFTSVGNLLKGISGPFPTTFASPPSNGQNTAGLSSINFADFKSGGAGWDAITQGYGRTAYAAWYIDGWHNGMDIAAKYGAPVYTPTAGTVLAAGNQDNYCPSRGFGKYVAVLDTKNNLVLWFAHLGTISVSQGQAIKNGDQIATVGNSGFETGTHLHFSIFKAQGFTMDPKKNGCGPDANGADINPIPYLGTTYQ